MNGETGKHQQILSILRSWQPGALIGLHMPTIKTRRNGVTTTWSEIIRGGKRVTKTRSATRGRTCYEYWGFPVSGVGMHKLGQFHRATGDFPIMALRAMQGGTQLKDFETAREAENWIVECDCWGELQGTTPPQKANTEC